MSGFLRTLLVGGLVVVGGLLIVIISDAFHEIADRMCQGEDDWSDVDRWEEFGKAMER